MEHHEGGGSLVQNKGASNSQNKIRRECSENSENHSNEGKP